MQSRLLQEFSNRPLTNEDFRKVASEFVPAGQPDRTLAGFFDTWVYGTGIPILSLERKGQGANVKVAGVDDDFTADVPLHCGERVRWVRVDAGDNLLDVPKTCELPAQTDFLYRRP
jgi:hypothetical protein